MANEKRLIDANALMKWLWDTVDDYHWGTRQYTADDIYNMLDDYPTVDAVEVVHGRWEPLAIQPNGFVGSYRCTACGIASINDSNYCTNCGAKMDGGNEDG